MNARTIVTILRRAARRLAGAPMFTVSAVAVLSLTMGAVIATLHLFESVVLRKLAVPEPERLAHIAGVTRTQPSGGALSLPAFQSVAQPRESLEVVFGWTQTATFTVEANGAASRATVIGATGNLFNELGARPAEGRLLLPSDENIAAARAQEVAVVSFPFWQRQLHGDRRMIGRHIVVEGRPFVVVGVAPKGFTGIGRVVEPDVTVPLSAFATFGPALRTSPFGWIWTAGRLRPGRSVSQVAAELSVVSQRIKATAAVPETKPARDELASLSLAVRPATRGVEPLFRPEFTRAIVAMVLMVALVMLIACVNTATLVLSREMARLNAVRVCLALGIPQGGLQIERLAEVGALSLAGAIGGTALAWAFGAAFTNSVFASEGLSANAIDLSTRWFTVACAAGIVLIATSLIGLASASGLSRHATVTGLQTKATTGHTGSLFIGVQVALSVVLLVSAALLSRGVHAFDAIERGIDTSNLMIGALYPRPGGYERVDNASYYLEVLRKVRAVPGVKGAAFSQSGPLDTPTVPEEIVRTRSMQDEGIRSFATAISPGYFATMGIRVVEGRDFGWSDNADGRRVAIVSRSLSAALRQPRIIGTRLRTGDYESLQDLEVVGVVEDATIADVRSTNQAVVYLPSLQLGEVANWKVLIVNGTASASPGIRTAVESSGRDFVSTIIALDDVFARGTARERFLTRMVTGLAGLALLLAGVGLYGLVTFEARQRRKEMAVRLALGAPRIHVVAAQLRPTAIATAIGAIAGIGLAFAVTPVLAAQLFDTTPYDVASFAVGAGSLVLVSLIASVPAVVGVLSRESQMTLRAE